jgi:MtN3 and saliva related transmembrane protein
LTEVIGWIGNISLITTMLVQSWQQWAARSTQGVSKWLFIGQLVASVSFLTYSVQLKNWVFVTSNLFPILTAVWGVWAHHRISKMEQRSG